MKGFNRPQVERFYELLSEQTEKYRIDGTMIYNMDETGIQTSTKRPPKVLSVKGKKQVGVISSTERGQTTTVVCCCNAAGSFLPPFMIFPRKRMQDRLLDGSPPETQATCSPSGWINAEIFLQWLQFFVSLVRPTAEKKALLLLDNHESHKSYPALEYASQNNVIILSLPPHTSNKLQPLDVAVYGPLKIFFEQEINRFQKAHPGRVINQYDVTKLFTPAYLKCATANNAIKGFQSPGIWPINKDIWGEEDYAPSSTTSTDRNTANQETTVQKSSSQDVETTINIERPSTSGFQQSSRRSPVLENVNPTDPSKSHPPSPSIRTNEENSLEIDSNEPIEYSTTSPGPSTAVSSSSFTPKEIRPLPTPYLPVSNRKRRIQKSEVLTSSPVRAEKKDRFIKTNDKATKNINKDLNKKPKITSNRKTTINKNAKTTKKNNANESEANENDNKNYTCYFCGENYIEINKQPIDDWIQCNSCCQWSHEKCTAYEGTGIFLCDNCNS